LTGHQHARQSHGASPAADHRLDQFAAAISQGRADNPAIASLADTEAQFIEAAMDIGAHLDRQTVGAAWLILGQLMGTRLQSTPPEQQAQALAMLFQVARLAGQRLYTGDRLPIEARCPFTYATGKPCASTIKGVNEKQFDTNMRAHIWQHHPDETWPPAEPEWLMPRPDDEAGDPA